ncbi:RNA polymerase II transcription factor B subunit 1 [Friedmanniomyces endolithicus]|uniref:RNA polymerase II transcription factor B subunit 1 n=1 Tax=Friedmanniomyces endolithicus TaxID=329885 RepID=A0AAN6FWE1_9PEZI|nr:RNA polymerase II transcription factor B subunit 1 [Friedmanniomyces endolithicus]KAK0325141.1 RNA polymerase II transcription factor B subunit 1 [Friedmanniomyces endolithicus]KAK0927735.1 RNA polymerase II transcription factor B subunit 1 [Friedmanniomyces endolithicus]KAK0999359.1 RNA polymerase II transcription factor B subunit 1 [Friedmanniomyces endolithicus]KAK1008744.1 RNA polymerase II transcription factor B subunit 1 [Friedmanniomyces endolithicus]
MSSLKTSVVYKKANGSLACDKRHLIWTPSIPSGVTPSLKIAVADITNLQQTGEASAKVALKVLVKDVSYVFSFTSKDEARKEQVAVTDTLRDAIATLKAAAASSLAPAVGTPGAAQNGGGDTGQSSSMAIAKALSAKPQDEGWYDDARLKSDFQLQRSLLESSKALDERFRQALRDKPETVSVPQFTAQFWSTRLHLLRAHAMEKSQKESEYNILPEIKYNTIIGADGEPIKMLNMTKEQVSLIFKQYPVVRQAYNETVPKPFADPKIFWSRFFASRLLKKLKEKNDPTDPALDRYLEYQEASGPASTAHIPHIIDLEGNEQNTKFHLEGDYEMRAAKHDRPILHLLNQMSEKLLSHVAPEDGDAHAPIGMDEGTFEQLQLRDLAMQDIDNRVVLNVREQQRYTGASGEDELSADARLYAKQDPNRVISSLQNDVQPQNLGSDEQGTLRLDRVLGYDSDDGDEDMDDEPNGVHTNGTSTRKVSIRVGSHAALTGASSSILSSMSQRRRNASTDAHGLNGLSQSVFDTLTITHNTTTEFLHYFWTLFLSGDSSRTSELTGLVSTLDRSLDRINAVGEQAEKERQERLEKMRGQVKEYFQRTGKKRRIDESAVGGGKAVVDEMVRPTVGALKQASEAYRRALEVQMREVAVGGQGSVG